MATKRNDVVTVRLPRWVAEQLGGVAYDLARKMEKAEKRLGWRTVPGQGVLCDGVQAAVETMNEAGNALYVAECENKAPF